MKDLRYLCPKCKHDSAKHLEADLDWGDYYDRCVECGASPEEYDPLGCQRSEVAVLQTLLRMSRNGVDISHLIIEED